MTRMRMIVWLALMTSACGKTPWTSPAIPAPSPPAVSPPSQLSGVVYEATSDGLRPLPGAALDISVEYQTWPPKQVTGADGRYQWTGVGSPDQIAGTGASQLKVIAFKPGYSQPCRAPVDLRTTNVRDVFVVSDALLSTTGLPSSFSVVGPTLAGTVYELTRDGSTTRNGTTTPLAGVSLTADFTGGNGWAPSAYTMSGANGSFLLCGVDSFMGLELIAAKSGYTTTGVLVDVTRSRTVDIFLARGAP